MNSGDWMHGSMDQLREAQYRLQEALHALSMRMHNHGNLCARIEVQNRRIIELLEMAADPAARNSMATGLNLTKLLQWPMLPYLIAGGLLMANFKAPEIAEFLKLFAAIQ